MSAKHDIAAEDGRHLLEKCSLFAALDGETRRLLTAHATRRKYSVGEIIFQIGSPGQTMMAVLTGTVRITVRSPQGKEIVLADLPSGEVFGEIALLDGRERTADAVALTNCEMVVLERRDVLPFLERHPKVCLKLMEVLCDRLRHADERITEMAFSELPIRLAKVLMRTTVHQAGPPGTDRPLKVALSQRELGSMIGGTRESVNRCLREWQRRGIVHLQAGWIVIQSPIMLEELATLG